MTASFRPVSIVVTRNLLHVRYSDLNLELDLSFFSVESRLKIKCHVKHTLHVTFYL